MKREKTNSEMYNSLAKRIILVFILSFFFLHFSFAQESSHSLWLQASSKIEAKLGYTFNYQLPFLQGESALTEGNNLKFDLTGEVTPISLNGVAVATLTPVAFLEFALGGRIGTGWSIDLFGSKIEGMGLTKADENNDLVIFDRGGLYTKFHASGTFQFDLAAIFPGDWNHIVFRTIQEINYAANTKAKGTDSWIFESSSSEYINGFHYYSSYVIGYQMPIFLSMVAFMAEGEKNFYDIQNQKVWGGDLMHWTLSPVMFFDVHKNIEIMLAAQFRTRINYIEADWEDKYHRTLTVDRSDPLKFEFYRVAAVVTYKF